MATTVGPVPFRNAKGRPKTHGGEPVRLKDSGKLEMLPDHKQADEHRRKFAELMYPSMGKKGERK